MIVTLWFDGSTYAVAKPVIPAPIVPNDSPWWQWKERMSRDFEGGTGKVLCSEAKF